MEVAITDIFIAKRRGGELFKPKIVGMPFFCFVLFCFLEQCGFLCAHSSRPMVFVSPDFALLSLLKDKMILGDVVVKSSSSHHPHKAKKRASASLP